MNEAHDFLAARDFLWQHRTDLTRAREFALQALRSRRRLNKTKLGVLYYGDEGRDCAHSAAAIRAAAARAGRVLVLRPGNANPEGGRFITQRRRNIDIIHSHLAAGILQ